MKKILITGITGFAGSYLAEHLSKNNDYVIYGTYLSETSLENIKEIKDKLNLSKIDLMDSKAVNDLINLIKPDLIFHLAALTSPGDSFNNPSETMTNNITAQINLLEAINNNQLTDSRILIVSSGDIYGVVLESDLPINENVSFKPLNPYAVSKLAQDFLGLQYALSYKLGIIRVRPFNHIGPKQSPSFVVSSFAKKIAEIEKGLPAGRQGEMEPVLKVGNLMAKRDFTDVRDMVIAYSLILEKGEIGEVYNIGSGISYKIEEILKKLLSFSKTKISVEEDQALFRPIDTPELRADSGKLKKVIDWTPKIPIDQTLKETLDYWRGIV